MILCSTEMAAREDVKVDANLGAPPAEDEGAPGTNAVVTTVDHMGGYESKEPRI